MSESEKIVRIGRPGQRRYCSLSDLPRHNSVAGHAFGSGWWELDEIFKFYRGQFVVVTGYAGHGKSTFLLNVLVKLAKERGVKSFLYVPENEFYLYDKLEKIYNRPQTFAHFAENQCFVQTSFAESDQGPPQTLQWILDQASMAIADHQVEIVMIDPWNEIERAMEKGEMLTDYIGYCLMCLKNFCRRAKVSVIMVAHPTKAAIGRVPTLADIEGSMNWFNKCDNGLTVWRDEAQSNVCKIISSKVREEGAGRVGSCYFSVDSQTGIFTPNKGGVTFG